MTSGPLTSTPAPIAPLPGPRRWRAVAATEQTTRGTTQLAAAGLDRVTGDLRPGGEPHCAASLSKVVVAVHVPAVGTARGSSWRC